MNTIITTIKESENSDDTDFGIIVLDWYLEKLDENGFIIPKLYTLKKNIVSQIEAIIETNFYVNNSFFGSWVHPIYSVHWITYPTLSMYKNILESTCNIKVKSKHWDTYISTQLRSDANNEMIFDASELSWRKPNFDITVDVTSDKDRKWVIEFSNKILQELFRTDSLE